MIPITKILQNPRFVVLGESPKDLYEYLQSDEMLFVRNRTIVAPTLGDQPVSKTLQKGNKRVKLCLTLFTLNKTTLSFFPPISRAAFLKVAVSKAAN